MHLPLWRTVGVGVHAYSRLVHSAALGEEGESGCRQTCFPELHAWSSPTPTSWVRAGFTRSYMCGQGLASQVWWNLHSQLRILYLAAVSNAEDPEKLLDQVVQEMQEDLVSVVALSVVGER